MARFYFDVHEGGQPVRDAEGSEFDNHEAAVQAAARSAAEIGMNWLARGNLNDVVIDIRDGRNQQVCSVTASIRIDWHLPRR